MKHLHSQDGDPNVIIVLKILAKNNAGSENIIPDPSTTMLLFVIFCLWRGVYRYLDGGWSPGLGPPLLHKGGVRLRLGVLHQERLVLPNQQTELDRANLLTNQKSESDNANLLTNRQSELKSLKLVLRIWIRIDPHQF